MDFKYELKTGKSFEVAVEDLKKELAEVKFGVLWELNFKDKLQEKGLDFNKNFKVFEVCNPPRAKEVMDQYLEAGYMLPCKMVVYEKEDGVRIGMLKPTYLVDMLQKDGLDEIAAEVEEALKGAIDKAVKETAKV